MRWNSECELVAVTVLVNGEGIESEIESRRSVFCNEQRSGLDSWAAARSAGLHADASLELRTEEYQGEPVCVWNGVKYDVENARRRGEFTVLTLARRLGDLQGE